MNQSGVPYVYYGLTEAHYLAEGKWLQQLLAYIKSQQAVIDYYETVITEYNAAIKE